ncbi:geranyl transferase [Aliidiomarina iranensis]|uniref:Geranyl transferase n=1 Tax=Aliidiomarina iranensis TaxID=1434071 RepID=A0A432VV80_9GAMM|nr:polyprenyl synthetase family protein [Aliidiomarina iranensis]RUO20446.1 geranyl transferase [Aliidiomarina iranensis]
MSAEELLAERLNYYRERHVNYLTSIIERKAPAENLRAAMAYAVLLGGKRVRPFLVYATGSMLGADESVLDAPAAAIECIHAYSLVHDDLPAMDDDALRRGKNTCHIEFDEATAILAGDALQSLAFELLSQPMAEINAQQQLAMIATLANASGLNGMCGGQALDIAATGITIEEDALAQIHELKTGALLRAAIRLGALSAQGALNAEGALSEKRALSAGGALSETRALSEKRALSANVINEQTLKALDNFADTIGLAFQVKDDILDVTGTTQALGKLQGADAALAKSTYPALLGLAGSQELLRQLHQKALHALSLIPYNTVVLEQFTEYLVTRDR